MMGEAQRKRWSGKRRGLGEVAKNAMRQLHVQLRRLRLQQARHVFDTEDMNALLHELLHKVEIVLQRVLRLLRRRDVAGVAHDGLADTTSLLGRIDTKLHLSGDIIEQAVRRRTILRETHVLKVVQGVEDTEDIESILHGLLREVVDGVVPGDNCQDSPRSHIT